MLASRLLTPARPSGPRAGRAVLTALLAAGLVLTLGAAPKSASASDRPSARDTTTSPATSPAPAGARTSGPTVLRQRGPHRPHRKTKRTWLSGASGAGVANGSFGRWRGRTAEVAGTWNDDYEGQINQWSLRPGAEYADWDGALDIAVGGIYTDRGETWAAAARGAYDQRWSQMLRYLAVARAGVHAPTYVRFAHEFNGSWYPWSVSRGEVADFKKTWRRFAALRDEAFPRARMVFAPTSETAASQGFDWRLAFPGSKVVDLVAVDYYNQYPFVTDRRGFSRSMRSTDTFGAPRGLDAHRRFALKVGLPFAISEWSTNADMGDSPAFVRQMHRWMVKHAGRGPGRLRYEIAFNVAGYDNNQFQMYPQTRQPRASGTYRRLW